MGVHANWLAVRGVDKAELLEQLGWRELLVASRRVDVLCRVQDHVEAGEVHRGERAHGVTESELARHVDVGRRRDAGLDDRDRLVE